MIKYSVAFLIPKDAKRFLGDDGWEFESDSRISSEIENLLKKEFVTNEVAPDFSSYEAENIKIDLFKDVNGQIENMYFRFYNGVSPVLPRFLEEYSRLGDLDFFIP